VWTGTACNPTTYIIFLFFQLNTLKDLDHNMPSFTLHDKHPCKFQNPHKSGKTLELRVADTKKGVWF
jgi:hypothetical protein